MADYVFRIDRSALARELTGPQGIATRAVARMSRQVMNEATQRAPVDTGNLRRTIQTDPIQVQGNQVIGGVSVTANYARFVHDGTAPHVIRPRRARALRWQGAGGRAVFAMIVHHPGTRPRPFLLNALNRVASRIR